MLSDLFFIVVVIGLIISAWHDRHHPSNALRRNYPLAWRIKPIMPWISRWLRHNVTDPENSKSDKPFSRRDIEYVHTAAEGRSPLLSFGTEDHRPLFRFFTACYPYPARADETYAPEPLIIGNKAAHPYVAKQRIIISALSFGALSGPAVEAISRGAKHFGTLYNVGEGGVSASQLSGGADLILQVGTAKYVIGDDAWSISAESLARVKNMPQVKLIEIKLGQGASLGKEGGFLPGQFMNQDYADARHRPIGFDTVAPNRHPEIHSDEALAKHIAWIRKQTGKPVGIKLALAYPGQWDSLWAYLAKQLEQGDVFGLPDFITVDGGEGGTVAGKVAFLQHIGLPLLDALPDLVRSLTTFRLRAHIPIIASGKLATPERAAMAFCLGADLVAIGRGVMFSLGCIQAMRCIERTCPTGITTHNSRFTRGIVPAEKGQRVASYLQQLHLDINAVAHACNKRTYAELTRQDIGLASDGFLRHGSSTATSKTSPLTRV